MSLVSSIIPVHNRAKMLAVAVQSVADQTYRPIEIIVVDDGSTDETPQVADDLARQRPNEIRVLHTKNQGPGLAREAGRQAARGEFIQYLDSDDRLTSGKFAAEVAALRSHPECGAAYGCTRLVNEKGDVLAAPFKRTGEALPELFPHLLIERWWNTHTPLYRRSVCDRVGPWADMWLSEDWDYDARVGGLKTRLVHCPEYLSDQVFHSGDRLTGKGVGPQFIRDHTRVLGTLYRNAVQAGVSADSSQMRAFSRWAFLVARQAGDLRLPSEARECFQLARRAAGEERARGLDFRLYAAFSRLFGWTLPGRICCFRERWAAHFAARGRDGGYTVGHAANPAQERPES